VQNNQEEAKKYAERIDGSITITSKGPIFKQKTEIKKQRTKLAGPDTKKPKITVKKSYEVADPKKAGAPLNIKGLDYKTAKDYSTGKKKVFSGNSTLSNVGNELVSETAKVIPMGYNVAETAAGWAAKTYSLLPGKQPKAEAIRDSTKDARQTIEGRVTTTALDYNVLNLIGKGANSLQIVKNVPKYIKPLKYVWNYVPKTVNTLTKMSQRADVLDTTFNVGEKIATKNSEFKMEELKNAANQARPQAMWRSDNKILNFGANVVGGVTVFAKNKKKFKENLRKIGKEKGYNGEQLDRFVDAASKSEIVTGINEITQQVAAVEAGAEGVGQKLKRAPVKFSKNNLWTSIKVGANEALKIAPIGSAEAIASLKNQNRIRGTESTIKDYTKGAIFGGGTAAGASFFIGGGGTLRGLAKQQNKQLQSFAGLSTEKSTQFTGYALDLGEGPGDLFYKYIESPITGKSKPTGYTVRSFNPSSSSISNTQPATNKMSEVPSFTDTRTKISGSKIASMTEVPSFTDTKTNTESNVNTKSNVNTESNVNTDTFVNTSVNTFDKGAFPLIGILPAGYGGGFTPNRNVFGFTTAAKVKNLAALSPKFKNKIRNNTRPTKQSFGNNITKNLAKALKTKKVSTKNKNILRGKI